MKANKKLSALSRMATSLARFLTFEKKRLIVKAFIESQFKYCPLVWLFHSREANNKVNKLHERALRIIYDDYASSFHELLVKDRSFSVHHCNIQFLAIEIYKIINGISNYNFQNLLIRNTSAYNLRSAQDFILPSVNTVLWVKNSIKYFGPLIWNLIPDNIKNADNLSLFKAKIKKWKPQNCPCRR